MKSEIIVLVIIMLLITIIFNYAATNRRNKHELHFYQEAIKALNLRNTEKLIRTIIKEELEKQSEKSK
ncbi:MAG: hypothetical protein RR531_12385 [Longicatena sp.]